MRLVTVLVILINSSTQNLDLILAIFYFIAENFLAMSNSPLPRSIKFECLVARGLSFWM